MLEHLNQLALDLRAVFADCGHPRVPALLADWPGATSVPVPSALPVLGSLSRLPAQPGDLGTQLMALSSALRWQQTYTAKDFGPVFLDRYGWTLLVGPKGPVACTSNLAGFLLLGPGIEYPVHQHAAEEAYVVVAGTASWKIGAADWAPLPPGSVVHNPPWQAHGMRTDQGTPLLLAFLWRAGAVEKSRFRPS